MGSLVVQNKYYHFPYKKGETATIYEEWLNKKLKKVQEDDSFVSFYDVRVKIKEGVWHVNIYYLASAYFDGTTTIINNKNAPLSGGGSVATYLGQTTIELLADAVGSDAVTGANTLTLSPNVLIGKDIDLFREGQLQTKLTRTGYRKYTYDIMTGIIGINDTWGEQELIQIIPKIVLP